MSNVHCIVFAEREVKQMHTNFLIHSACLYVCVCVRSSLCLHMWMTVRLHTYIKRTCCNDKTETRDALQLLVPSDEAESSSDRFHLPCLNLNLPGCGTSNSLRTNGICQPTSKCFSFLSLP